MNLRTRLAGFGVLAATAVAAQPGGEPSLGVRVEPQIVSVGTDFNLRFALERHGETLDPGATAPNDLALVFPGFQRVQAPRMEPRGSILVAGRVGQPGMFAFEATLRHQGKAYTVRDHVVALGGSRPDPLVQGGYYVFLGRGDYWEPAHQLSSWSLIDWKRLVDWLDAQRLDTLFVLLNGYTLAYPSERYPSLRDPFSENARSNFLDDLIDYAHSRSVKVYLTLTTDDHAEGFGRAHPETVRVNKYGDPRSRRALNLEHPLVERYITDIVEEVLDLYPRADGLVVHPTEEDPDRFNRETKDLYRQETGRELSREPKAVRYRWYNRRFASLLTKLDRLAVARNPAIDVVMFNCWWQDEYVSIYQDELPRTVRFCVWYYGWEDLESVRWPIYSWVDQVGPSRIIYMPTGRAFMYPAEPWEEIERHIGTDRLISTARALGVTGTVFFAGWNLGTDDDRLRDLMLARFPTVALEPDPERRLALVPRLYEDYLGARTALLSP